MGYNYKQFDDITLIVMHYRSRDKDGVKIPLETDAPLEIAKEFITDWSWGKERENK